MSEKTGYIYILTNKSFHQSNLVKIGYATDVKRRVKELSNTSVPEPFEIYATYEVPFDSKMPDKALHSLIQKLNPGLRITPNREFFEIEPWDAYDLLKSMAIIHNREDKLVRYSNNDYGSDLGNETPTEYSVESLFPLNSNVRSLYDSISNASLNRHKHLVITPLKHYVAFKKDRKHNSIALWPKDGWIEVVLCAKLGCLVDDSNSIYDISNRQWPAAQYAMRFDESTDIKVFLNLLDQVVGNSK